MSLYIRISLFLTYFHLFYDIFFNLNEFIITTTERKLITTAPSLQTLIAQILGTKFLMQHKYLTHCKYNRKINFN